MFSARSQELPRLDRIAEAMRPARAGDIPNVELPKDPLPQMLRLAQKAETNYMPLVVDTFSQALKVDNYFSSFDTESPWVHWQRNRMDARQTGIHRSALQYGAAYATVLPGDIGPAIRGYSPRSLTAVYQDPTEDEWPMLALHVDGNLVTLYDEESVYRFGMENTPRSGAMPALAAAVAGGMLTFIESFTHGVGRCPVVRYRDRMLLAGEEQYGIVEPLLNLQARINETTFEMLISQYYSAFKQRYVIGWVPKSEEESLKASASEMWTFEDPDVKVGQFAEATPNGYIESNASAKRDLSAIAQLPAQNLGIDAISNISDATLAGLEAAKRHKGNEMATSLGESHEQLLRLCAFIAGDQSAATDFASEVHWANVETRSFAQTVDGLTKLGQMLGVPNEILWADIPGWSDADVQRARDAATQADALMSLQTIMANADVGAIP